MVKVGDHQRVPKPEQGVQQAKTVRTSGDAHHNRLAGLEERF